MFYRFYLVNLIVISVFLTTEPIAFNDQKVAEMISWDEAFRKVKSHSKLVIMTQSVHVNSAYIAYIYHTNHLFCKMVWTGK